MSFDRYCGMASAAAILLSAAFVGWTGLWGPLWDAAWKMQASDALNVIVAVIGWIVTIGIGAVAFGLSQRQIRLAREQLALQQEQMRMQQGQIAETREELRHANFLRLEREFRQLGESLDRLRLAGAFLETVSSTFPKQGTLGGWSVALFRARQVAAYIVSETAAKAPFGYGERILTILKRIGELGDRMTDGVLNSMPGPSVLNAYDQRIASAIEVLRALRRQIADEIPEREAQLFAIADERDLHADRTTR